MSSRLDEIHAANGEVLGISVDSPFSLAKWAEQEGFSNVTLLSDLGKEVMQAYGCMFEELIGLKGVSKRAAFVVDPSGNISHMEVLEETGVLPDLDTAFAKLMGQ